jgi:Domain of unknown function (DUF397)
MEMTDLSGAIWRKASASVHNGGCVEVAVNLPGIAALRDSKRPEAGALVIDLPVFAAFLADIREARHNLPGPRYAHRPPAALADVRRPACGPG